MKKKVVVFILVFVLLSTNCFTNAEIFSTEDAVTMSDAEFDDDSVIVVFKKSHSGINKVFKRDDFSGIKVKSVEDLSRHVRNFIADKKAEKLEALKLKNISSYNSNIALEITDEAIIEEYDIDAENFKNFVCIELEESGKDKVLEAVEELNKRDDVLYAAPNYIHYAEAVYPNDEYYENNQQWAIDAIQLPEAWEHTKGSDTIRVGVMDTGIDVLHPELTNKVSSLTNENFTDQGYALDDESGHGTHVAGIIGAATNNQTGVAGTCWNVELVSLKVFQKVFNESTRKYEWRSNDSDVINAIISAIGKDIDILNYSGGGYTRDYIGTDEDDVNTVDEAIEYFDGLFVCSAGNDAVNTDVNKHYPSSYDCDNIISVTSFNSLEQLPSNRNYGATTVDLAAPGEGIYSTYPTALDDDGHTDGYKLNGGTSMAAPYVTGVAALMMSANPALKNDPVKVKNIILSTVDKNSNFTGKCVSGGMLNAYKAVLGATNNYTYSPVDVSGGRFFYTDDTDWFCLSCTNRVMTANINNDGKTDLLGINYDGDICYSLNNGRGTYQNQTKITFGGFSPSWFSNSSNRRVWVADVNADGYDDLIGVSSAGKIYTAINNQNNTFAAPVMRTGTAFVSSSGWFSTAARERVWPGDINGDGRADLMGISTEGHVYYALANSNGGYSSQTKITVTNGFANSWFSTGYNNRLWVADVNADGYDDFIGVSVDGHIYTSINNGNFTFTTPTSKGGTAFVSSSAWFSTTHSGRVWPADVNADGRCDLVGISSDGNVYTCTANSDGTYGGQVRNLVLDGTKYEEGWFSSSEKSRMFIGFVDRYADPDFIAISPTGYAHVSLQLCRIR